MDLKYVEDCMVTAAEQLWLPSDGNGGLYRLEGGVGEGGGGVLDVERGDQVEGYL